MNEPTGILDNVNHPQHYEGNTSLECIDVMEIAFGTQAVAHFCLCNAFKYLWRHKHKNGLEDLKKARWYLDRFDKIAEQFNDSVRLNRQYYKLKELCEKAKKRMQAEAENMEEKLEHAFNNLHLSDRNAAKYAGTNKTRATRYRKNHNIAPRGGAST